MAVTRKAVGNSATGTASVIATDYPAGAAPGDLAILFCVSGNGGFPAAPSGFTQGAKCQTGSGGTDVGSVSAYYYWRVLDGSEGPSVNAPRCATHTHAVIMLFNGFDPADPVVNSIPSSGTPANTSAFTDTIAEKAGDANDLFLAFYGHDRDSSTPSVLTSSDFANLAGESITTLINESTTQSGGDGLVVIEGDPASDSSGDVSHSVTITSSIWAGMLLRINAAAAGGTTIEPDDGSHAHSSTSPSISSKSTLAPNNAVHGHAATSPAIAAKSTLAPASAAHAHSAGSPSVAADSSIAPDSAAHAHAAGQPTILPHYVFSPANCIHAHAAASPTVSAPYQIDPDDAFHGGGLIGSTPRPRVTAFFRR